VGQLLGKKLHFLLFLPDFIKANNLKINYGHYITNKIMKQLLQVFALVLENMKDFRKKRLYSSSLENTIKKIT
jgi:hypothetical protein